MPEIQPQITIVIPVHNRAGIVGKTLESIRQQSHRPLSVVLVDNNSTDSTLSVLRQWKAEAETPDMQVTIATETMPGATAARNRGLSLVTTPYVMFFDSDDTMAPGHVARAVEAFLQYPATDIVGWNIGLTLQSGKRITRNFNDSDTLWNCIMHGSMATQRYAMRTSLANKAGKWNSDIPGWNDIEFGIRLLLQKPVVMKLHGEITVETFNHPQSITGTGGFSPTPWKWEQSLDEIERHMPNTRTVRYVRMRRAVLAGDYARENAEGESDRLLQQVLASEKCPFYRCLYRLVRIYNARGGRGIARLMRPLF